MVLALLRGCRQKAQECKGDGKERESCNNGSHLHHTWLPLLGNAPGAGCGLFETHRFLSTYSRRSLKPAFSTPCYSTFSVRVVVLSNRDQGCPEVWHAGRGILNDACQRFRSVDGLHCVLLRNPCPVGQSEPQKSTALSTRTSIAHQMTTLTKLPSAITKT